MPCLAKIIHDNGATFQEMLEKVEKSRKLSEIITKAIELCRVIAVKIVEEELKRRSENICKWPKCPECGSRIENKGKLEREIKGLIGIVRWKRKVGRCPRGCKIEQIVPLDEELGLRPHQRVSDELKKAACALAVFVPFATAATLLKILTGTKVSGQGIWLWVQEFGIKAMEMLDKELHSLQAGERIEPEEADSSILQLPAILGGDGVCAPFRPNEGTPEGQTQWKEIKVGIVTRMRQYINTKGRLVTRLIQRRLVAVLGSKDEFSLRMDLEAKKQSIHRASTVAWISDGGPGFWGIFDDLFAHLAIGILDFYHASQYLWKAAKAWLDGRTNSTREWFYRARHRLRYGDLLSIKVDLSAAPVLENLPESTAKVLINCRAYLERHERHIEYTHFKALGLPIGSGMVESACKWLIQQRFKGVGMRWSTKGFNNLLHLRLAWVNGRFENVFTPAINSPPNS